jgi:hypothetical protein
MFIKLTKTNKIEVNTHGGKAVGLHELTALGFNIPLTIILPMGYEPDFEIISTITSILGKQNPIIVRSSSPYEDMENKSMAGVFNSEITDSEYLIQVIKNIRKNAKIISSKLNLPQNEIPLLLQPVINCPFGGVYLSDINSNDRLVISSLGVSSVTSGINGAMDTLSESDPIYKQALTQLRKLRDKSEHGIDVEFTIDVESKITFLQKRRNNSLIEIEVELEGFKLSDHFPFVLSNLEGSIWHNLFEEVFPHQTKFVNNRIYDRNREQDTEAKTFNIDETELSTAYNLYHNVLFPNWENVFLSLKKELSDNSNAIYVWNRVYSEWKRFYTEYFSNPHHKTISLVKNQLLSGVSIAPCIVNWINNLYSLSDKYSTSEFPSALENFISNYHYYFFTNNCFSEPSLEESPEIIEVMIKNMPATKRKIEIETNPSLELKVSWLCEEDNRFKNMFNYLIRKAVIKLSTHLAYEKIISEPNISLGNSSFAIRRSDKLPFTIIKNK